MLYIHVGPVCSMILCRGVEMTHHVGQGLPTHPLPPLQPFRKQLYYAGRREDKAEILTDSVPVHLHGMDPVSRHHSQVDGARSTKLACVIVEYAGFMHCLYMGKLIRIINLARAGARLQYS